MGSNDVIKSDNMKKINQVKVEYEPTLIAIELKDSDVKNPVFNMLKLMIDNELGYKENIEFNDVVKQLNYKHDFTFINNIQNYSDLDNYTIELDNDFMSDKDFFILLNPLHLVDFDNNIKNFDIKSKITLPFFNILDKDIKLDDKFRLSKIKINYPFLTNEKVEILLDKNRFSMNTDNIKIPIFNVLDKDFELGDEFNIPKIKIDYLSITNERIKIQLDENELLIPEANIYLPVFEKLDFDLSDFKNGNSRKESIFKNYSNDKFKYKKQVFPTVDFKEFKTSLEKLDNFYIEVPELSSKLIDLNFNGSLVEKNSFRDFDVVNFSDRSFVENINLLEFKNRKNEIIFKNSLEKFSEYLFDLTNLKHLNFQLEEKLNVNIDKLVQSVSLCQLDSIICDEKELTERIKWITN